MKNKYYIVLALVFIFLPLLIIVFTISDMSSNPSVKITDENIYLKTPLCVGITIEYKDINDVEYLNKIDFGQKVKGKNSIGYTARLYKNEVFGNYYIVVDNGCNEYTKIKYKNEYYILNLETLNQKKSV